MSRIHFTQDVNQHPLHYFTLLATELIGFWGLLWFSYDRGMQFATLLSMAAAYVVWGIIHHQEHKDLAPNILFEYLLMATLAVLLLGPLILRT